MAGFGGFSAAFSTGERPVWDSLIFRDLVLGNSLTGGAAAANEKPAEKAGVKQLSDALGMLTAQLYVLSNSSTLAPALKPVVGRVHAPAAAEHCIVHGGEARERLHHPEQLRRRDPELDVLLEEERARVAGISAVQNRTEVRACRLDVAPAQAAGVWSDLAGDSISCEPVLDNRLSRIDGAIDVVRVPTQGCSCKEHSHAPQPSLRSPSGYHVRGRGAAAAGR